MPQLPWPCVRQWLALAVLTLPALQSGVRGPLAAATRSRAVARQHLGHRRHRGGSDAERDEPVQADPGSTVSLSAVNDTLHDILETLESERQAEAENHNLLFSWCQTQNSELTGMLSEVQGKVQMNEVNKKELEALLSNLENELSKIMSEAQAAQDEVAQAEDLDAEDDAKHKQDVNLNSQAVEQLTEAIKIVSEVQNQGGFLQEGILKRLQLNEPGESSFVLGVMKRLRTGLQDTRQKIVDSFTAKQEARSELMNAKHQQIAFLETERTDKNTRLTQDKLHLVEVNRELNRDTEEVPKIQSRIEDAKVYCEDKEKAWKVREEDRGKEKSALREAINYLGQSSKELGLKSPADVEDDDSGEGGDYDDAPMDGDIALLRFQQGLQRRGRRTAQQPFLLQVGSAKSAAVEGVLRNVGALKSLVGSGAKEDDVKEVVRNMATLLQQQQKHEDEFLEQCKSDFATKTAEVAKTTDELNKIIAAIDYGEAEIGTSTNEVNAIYTDVDNANDQLKGAAEFRKKEKSEHEASTKDRKLTIKVLKQAEHVLQQFYESHDETAGVSSFRVRRRQASPPPETWSGSSRQTYAGLSVVDLIQKVRESFEKAQEHADQQETDAAAAFAKLTKDSKTDFDNSMQEVTDRMKRKGTLTVTLNSNKEKKAQREQDLQSLNNQLNSLRDECMEIVTHHEDRKKARAFELSQLQDVLDILSGAQVAVRTGVTAPPPTVL